MKILIIVLTLIFCSHSFAGPGPEHGHSHSHEAPTLSQKEATDAAQSQIQRLIELKKIDDSWKNANFSKAEKKEFNHEKEWMVTFGNDKSTREKKLYIFLRPNGEFIAANFTGK